MTILGIDQSLTSTGICIMNKEGEFNTLCIKPKMKGMERLMFIEKQIEQLLLKFKTDLYVVMEGYSYGSIGRTFELGELGGMIKMLLNKHGIPYSIVPPTVWKKEIIGKGNANKDTIKWEIEKKYGLIFKTQDETDSWCMAEHVRRKIK